MKLCDKMVTELKVNFLSVDYHISLFKNLQNLKQKDFGVKEYIEKFDRLGIQVGHVEDDDDKVVRYAIGLQFFIQDEISMVMIIIVEGAYQYALKVEEKLARKQQVDFRGRCKP